MLEGKELEGKIGDAGSYSLDVDDKGVVKISVVVNKEFSGVKVSSTNAVETNIFKIAEGIAAKTKSTWDDTAIAALEKLLGITPG